MSNTTVPLVVFNSLPDLIAGQKNMVTTQIPTSSTVHPLPSGLNLDKPLNEIISGSVRFLAKALTDKSVEEKLQCTLQTSAYENAALPDDEKDYWKLSTIFMELAYNPYSYRTLEVGRNKSPGYYSRSDKEKAVFAYLSEQEATPGSIKALTQLLLVYQLIVKKADKEWKKYYHPNSLLSTVSEVLSCFAERNIDCMSMPISNSHYRSSSDPVDTFFIPPTFFVFDMEVDTFFEALVHGGCATRNVLRKHEYFDNRHSFWVFSLLIKQELTEYFLIEFLTLMRKPTYFGRVSFLFALVTQYGNEVRLFLNPKFKKARTSEVIRQVGRINTYRIETLNNLLPMLDSIDPLAIDLMALELEDTSMARAKYQAQSILSSAKNTYHVPVLGHVSKLDVIDKYVSYVEGLDREREEWHAAKKREAIETVVKTLFSINQAWLNELCFGYTTLSFTIPHVKSNN